MIQANELRIGNKVNLIALDQIIEIESVNRVEGLSGLFTWINEEEEYEDSLTAIDPIPLTPEILSKCGFVQHAEIKHLFFLNEFRVNTSMGWVTLLRKCDKAGESQREACGSPFITDRIKCASLHQLQNLFYALTGKELEYKP